METQTLGAIVEALRHDFVNIRLFPVIDKTFFTEPTVVNVHGTPAINIVSVPLTRRQQIAKASFDKVFALAAIVACAPLMAAIAVLVKCTSPGPVFFRQTRRGAGGNRFTILKFRSMYQHQERNGVVTQAAKSDPRITPLGRILRKTSLDELPQFFNVLAGDMSIVGPRPHATEHDERYKELVDKYMYRYRIKPGITGLAQVNGFRGETDRIEKMMSRVELDLYYIRNWSFGLDIKIVFQTAAKVLFDKSAH